MTRNNPSRRIAQTSVTRHLEETASVLRAALKHAGPKEASALAGRLVAVMKALETAPGAGGVPEYPGCLPGMTPQDMMDAHQAMEDEITELIEARVQERVAPRLEEAVQARLAEMGLAEMRPACEKPELRPSGDGSFGEARGEADGAVAVGRIRTF